MQARSLLLSPNDSFLSLLGRTSHILGVRHVYAVADDHGRRCLSCGYPHSRLEEPLVLARGSLFFNLDWSIPDLLSFTPRVGGKDACLGLFDRNPW